MHPLTLLSGLVIPPKKYKEKKEKGREENEDEEIEEEKEEKGGRGRGKKRPFRFVPICFSLFHCVN